MAYDYGDRQQRVDFLLTTFREMPPDHILLDDHRGEPVTAARMIREIEEGTDYGKGFVAIAGLVFYALRPTKKGPPPKE
jgi:hypothetical protein